VLVNYLTIRLARPNVVVNVNVPDVALADLRGMRPAPLARVGAVQMNITDTGQGLPARDFQQPSTPEPGTDAVRSWPKVGQRPPRCDP
jgi:hypothetical protein